MIVHFDKDLLKRIIEQGKFDVDNLKAKNVLESTELKNLMNHFKSNRK